MSEQIEDQLTEALAAVENTSIPDDLRAVAFASAFWVARAGLEPPPPTQAGPTPPGQTPPAEPVDPNAGPEAKIANKLKISTDDVEFTYEINGEDVAFAVPPSHLASMKKDAIAQIAYVLSAGRQAAGIESETSGRLLKETCDDCARTDTNFSRILGALHGEGLIVRGAGQAATIKVNRDGYERAAATIKQLRGQG